MNFGGHFTGVKSPPKFKFHIRNIIVRIRNINIRFSFNINIHEDEFWRTFYRRQISAKIQVFKRKIPIEVETPQR